MESALDDELSFNPRPCMRGDHFDGGYFKGNTCFNPRPCMRGDLTKNVYEAAMERFNPRPCMRGDGSEAYIHRMLAVSIHAPA